MTACIYRIRNTTNGRVYVGSAVDLEMRFTQHIRSLGMGKHWNRYLQSDWDSYGAQVFEFEPIEDVEGTTEAIIVAEERQITLAVTLPSGVYNIQRSCKSLRRPPRPTPLPQSRCTVTTPKGQCRKTVWGQPGPCNLHETVARRRFLEQILIEERKPKRRRSAQRDSRSDG